MNTKELLRPRYKVINIWPDMADRGYYQGQIIKLDQVDEKTMKQQWFVQNKEGKLYDAFFDMFPHLFKKLEWWEERKPEEMPEYVKWDYNPKTDNEDVKGLVEKVIKWVQDGHGVVTSGSMVIATSHWIPAIAAEYEEYINKKNNDE